MDLGVTEQQNLLISYDSSPNVMENLHKLLLKAIKHNDFQSFKRIVEENSKKQSVVTIVRYIDPNTEDTYLDIASRQGLTEFVEFLLCKGAEINRVNDTHNCAPVHFATKGGHVDTLAILLEQCTTDLDLEVEQRTALHVAVEKNDLKCADLLLEKGASASILNNKNLTAFHLAAMEGQCDMVKMMLDKYASRLEVDRYKDFNGQTTREVIEQKMPEMKRELSEKLLFKSENWEVDAQDLKYYLNDKDEANFLKCVEIIEGEIPPVMAETLLTTSAQYNFRQAVMAILKRFEGKHLNVRKAAFATVPDGHHVILGELLKVEPDMANDLILSVCQELGMPKKQGVDNTSNLLKCLELILEQSNVDVRCTDKKGNTPLHYAARADNRTAMSLLLKQGSYIGHMNKFNVPPIIDIPMCTLSDYFDDCLKLMKNRTNKYIIEFDYHCLMPRNIFTKQDTTQRATRETEVFLYIAHNKNLKHLLKHPLLSSFLYLKWLKIRHVLYANFVFYGIFYFMLNAYILSKSYESLPNENGTRTINDSFDVGLESTLLVGCYPESFLRIFVILLWLLFTVREIFQYACCPYRYMLDWENWLQAVLIIFIFILLCGAGLWSDVVVIILSALELITLISEHPKMSTSFEMFRTVSLNYVCLLFPYMFLIIAFALAFYTLFKNNRNFSDPGHSLFKTIIMITGEFNSNDIPFVSHPVWSHIVFVLFVFLIAIVLLNLLNGLAVSDTNKILSKAELIGLISRIRLIVYLEDIAFGEPFNWFGRGNSCFLRWNPFGFLINRLLLFPHYLENDTQVEIAEEEEEISVQNRLLNIYDLSSTKQALILLNALKCKDLLSFKNAINYRKDSPNLYINDVLNDSGKTCLDIVSKNGLTEFVPFLLKIGADPNKINEMHNRAPIHFAAEGRHVDTLAALLEAKSTKPDLQVGFQTALHFAVKNDDLNCVGLLLKKGASASIPNSMGVTALHLAAMEKRYDMVELILNSQPFSDIDTYKDYNDQTTQEIIQRILPELLLPKDKKSDINVNNLKYYLITKNETSFLLNLECVETETLLREVDESQVTSFLEIAIAFNFEKAVSKILEKFRGNLNVMKAAKLAVLHGHYAVLQKLLLVEPKIVDSENELLLLSCQQLGIPKRPKDNTSDQLKCLKLILQEDVDVRCADGKGNSPLHYAARAKYTEAITLLLNRNSYIGHMNAFKVPPIAHIPTRILSRYFDDCIQIRKGSMKEYVIEFDYNCLMPHDFLNKYDKGDKTIREMEVFQYIASNNNLKQLLIHPILSSFLYLKWRNMRCVLYASFILHVIFYILLNTYIFIKNSNNLANQNKTLQIVSDSLNITSKNFLQIYCQDSIVWILIIPLLLLFMFWEILQFISCPYHYLMSLISLKNLLHNILIVLTIVLMCGVNQVEIDTLLILLSVWELITLISQHKDISTKFEMFRTVSVTYVHLFWPFVLFILAFALAFYTLFKEKDFSNFTSSIFKTIIMLTGEFDAGNIPFDKNLIWSHIVFILFLFFFTIVLLNLLNGLAVNDTAEILKKAELIKLVSSIHVVAYIENLTMGKLCRYHFCNRNSKLLRWNPFGFLTKKIFLFPHKMRNGKVNIKQNCSVNDEYEFIEEDDRNNINDVNDDEYWTISKMDPNIIEQIKQNILNKNQLPDIEKMMEELSKLQEEMAAMKIALNTSKI